MSMSRLADYDRWDYVDESDEEAPAPAAPVDAPPPVRSSPEPEPASEDWMLEVACPERRVIEMGEHIAARRIPC